MIAYILKFIACSALLLILYHWLLEKEKMNTFNRFYLLFGLVFSALIPLLVLKIPIQNISTIVENMPSTSSLQGGEIISSALGNHPPTILANTTWQTLLWVIWGMVSLCMLARFCYNFYVLQKKIKGNIIVQNKNHQIVLLTEAIIPFSFGRYIFVDQQAYQQAAIAAEILLHEQAHVEQRHTLDILFVELMLVVAWWNPVVWLYRKAMMLNHEFLADEAVIGYIRDTSTYQYLLLDNIGQSTHLMMASSFNYLITKKRLIKMNKNTLKNRILMLQAAVVLFVGTLSMIFGEIGFAQTPTATVGKPKIQTTSTQEGVPQAMIEEYQQLIEKYLRKGVEDGKERKVLDNPNKADRTRLETIFKAMSKPQQEAQTYIMFPMPILSRNSPTEKELEAYKDPKVYGVWIDEKKVPNTALNKYKANDFSHVSVSRLYKNAQATIGFKYKLQLDLMTTAYYEKYQSEALAENKYFITYNNKKK